MKELSAGNRTGLEILGKTLAWGLALMLASCDETSAVAEQCAESDLVAQCPAGSNPTLQAEAVRQCEVEGGGKYDPISGSGAGSVAGACFGSGSCRVACLFETPCLCGVASLTKERVECARCDSACGNGECEDGETPASCASDCGGRCEAGESACASENKVRTCSADGVFVTHACGGGQLCRTAGDTASCVDVCEVGATRCDGDSLSTCERDGTWSTNRCGGERTCRVDDGMAVCASTCGVEGATRCSDGGIETCGGNGAWSRTPCPDDERCMPAPDGDSVVCGQDGCIEGQVRCIGTEGGTSQRERCDRSGRFIPDQCGDGQVCRSRVGVADCYDALCDPGATRCADPRTIETCNPQREWSETGRCPADEVCAVVDGTAQCSSTCDVGTAYCTEDRLARQTCPLGRPVIVPCENQQRCVSEPEGAATCQACVCHEVTDCCDGCFALRGRCNDGRFCTGPEDDACGDDGQCHGAAERQRCQPDEPQCQTARCDADQDACVSETDPAVVGVQACDDGLLCTEGETCQGDGTCGTGAPLDCSGGIETPDCQAPACDPVDGCQVLAANEGGVCAGRSGTCVGGDCARFVCDGLPCAEGAVAATVVDSLTGLEWEHEAPAHPAGCSGLNGRCTWAEAGNYCADLDVGGHDDWRLPEVKELLSIVDFTRMDPAVDLAAFSGIRSAEYWTVNERRTPRGLDPLKSWSVNLADGRIGLAFVDQSFTHVLCTRPSRPPQARPPRPVPASSTQGPSLFPMSNTSDPDVATDEVTGLLWERRHVGPMVNASWATARDACIDSRVGGFADWRLPTIVELASIADYSGGVFPWDHAAFGYLEMQHYWSSTPGLPDGTGHWSLTFIDPEPLEPPVPPSPSAPGACGAVTMLEGDNNPNFIHCVRDPSP